MPIRTSYINWRTTFCWPTSTKWYPAKQVLTDSSLPKNCVTVTTGVLSIRLRMKTKTALRRQLRPWARRLADEFEWMTWLGAVPTVENEWYIQYWFVCDNMTAPGEQALERITSTHDMGFRKQRRLASVRTPVWVTRLFGLYGGGFDPFSINTRELGFACK